MNAHATALATLALLALAGCGGGEPTFTNDVSDVTDPSVDPPRAVGAPFEPGERIDVGQADARFELELWSDFFEDVVAPGDLDGDGVDDLLVVSRDTSDAGVVPCDDGCPSFDRAVVHVIYGGGSFSGTVEAAASVSSWHINGLRFRVSAAGDLDGDGRADFLFGIGTAGCEQGNAFVVYGGPRLVGAHDVRELGAMLREQESCTGFGEVAGLGDFDGDGLDDFAVGAPRTDPSRIYVYPGGPRPTERLDEGAAAVRFVGGTSLAFVEQAGDVDGDGLGDLFIAERRNRERVEGVRLVLGADLVGLETIDPTSVGRPLPEDTATVAGVGDLDGDGVDDFAAILFRGDAAPRQVLVFLGASVFANEIIEAAAAASMTLDPIGTDFLYPSSLSSGDIDGDGRLELVVGDASYYPEELESERGAPRGIVHVVRGGADVWSGVIAVPDTTSFIGQLWVDALDDRRVRGADSLGAKVLTPDLDDDGLADLVMMASGAEDGGRVHIWLGRSR